MLLCNTRLVDMMFANHNIRGPLYHTGIGPFYWMADTPTGFVTDLLQLHNDRIQSLLEASTTLSP